MLVGYTHANWLYSGDVIKNVTSYDFTSSYPYCLVSEKYISSRFKKCKVKDINKLIENFAYVMRIRFYNIETNYYNNIISISKLTEADRICHDNGRLIKATMIEIVITEVDLKIIQKAYNFKKYEILEIYYATKDYLPIELVDFILEKYKNKTEYKNVEGKEVEYALEKRSF